MFPTFIRVVGKTLTVKHVLIYVVPNIHTERPPQGWTSMGLAGWLADLLSLPETSSLHMLLL